jgi:hypothetical protein
MGASGKNNAGHVPLLGNGCALHVVSRTLLVSTKSAVADGLLDEGEALHLSNFQCPC